MPDKLYLNKETGKKELFNSDYFVCPVCGHDDVEDKENELFFSGEEDQDLIKKCKNCGNEVKLYKEIDEQKDKFK
jgi:transcription elongation factor Elf1